MLSRSIALRMENLYKLAMSANDPYLGGYVPGKQESIPDGMRSALTNSFVDPVEPVLITAGRISKEMLTDIAQENVGLAFNKIASIAANGQDKYALAASKEIIEIAHPRKQDNQVNINLMPTRIELVVVPLAGQASSVPIVLDVPSVSPIINAQDNEP